MLTPIEADLEKSEAFVGVRAAEDAEDEKVVSTARETRREKERELTE
jgi:hypothetical protein